MCEGCRWSEWADVLDEMGAEACFDFASDTIGGIEEFVKDKEHITDGQKRALVNIWRSVQEDDGEHGELFREAA